MGELRIIAITNQKGGVAKTTTATSLVTGLFSKGYRTLLIDTDPQGNASDTFRAKIEDIATLYDVLCAGEHISHAIQKTINSGDILPSDPLLSNAESMIVGTGKEYRLKEALEPILKDYDFIIIDTPPTLGILLINALTAARSGIIPITADRYGIQGLAQLEETIGKVKKYSNPLFEIEGLLFAKYNSRLNLSKEVMDSMPMIAAQLGTKLYKSYIRESTAAKEAQASRTHLFSYAPSSTTAIDYMALINEILGE